MDYNNLDLRNKTFLDFTDDAKIIDEIIGGDIDSFLSHITDANRARTFIFFAAMTDDIKLIEAIEKEFDKEKNLMFTE